MLKVKMVATAWAVSDSLALTIGETTRIALAPDRRPGAKQQSHGRGELGNPRQEHAEDECHADEPRHDEQLRSSTGRDHLDGE
ncbi:MAG TPA: hypothetical protein VNG93_02115 [Candidatus Dormibacteraeota bacterium]|nr:hypothetical protein [Candidatus Dormibacteraeota bacterium]